MLVWQRNNNNNNKQRRHNETFTFVGAKISDQSHCEIWWVGRRRWWVRRWKRVQRRLVTDSLVRASSLMLFIFSASHFGCNETETQIENMTNNCFKYPLDTLFTRREERVCQAITSVPKQRWGQKISFGDCLIFSEISQADLAKFVGSLMKMEMEDLWLQHFWSKARHKWSYRRHLICQPVSVWTSWQSFVSHCFSARRGFWYFGWSCFSPTVGSWLILSHLTDRLTDYFCFVQLLMPMRSPLICCLRGKRCKTFTLCIIVLRASCCVCLPGEITIIMPINYEPKRLTHSAWAKEIAAIKWAKGPKVNALLCDSSAEINGVSAKRHVFHILHKRNFRYIYCKIHEPNLKT